MADVFLIALYIVAAKGVGVGRLETAWGLWLFTACVLGSLVVAHLTERALKRPAAPA
jgi:paraquat-inducible protein A